MSLIKKQKNLVLKRLSIRIEEGLFDRLTGYAEYLESSKDHVIAEAIRYIIDRDKDFTENLPRNPPQIVGGNLGANVGENRHQTTKASR